MEQNNWGERAPVLLATRPVTYPAPSVNRPRDRFRIARNPLRIEATIGQMYESATTRQLGL
jgi:hypothetical protein